MSNWIDEEFESERRANEDNKRRQQLIDYSNYWAKLKEQIRKDVEKISSLWKTKIIITDSDEGFKIMRTEKFPAVYITITNGGEIIYIEREIARDIENAEKESENLIVIVKNNHVYLKAGFTELLIPEKATEYILRPLLQVVRGEQT